ncbi:hypothetical protein AZ010_003903 [Klebsiella pneumoniae]|nr:hypothetical protein AZ010_003903 [Klebsiella pneumoniae]
MSFAGWRLRLTWPTSLSLSRMAARSALSGLPDGLEP